jgi:hypothetical protein
VSGGLSPAVLNFFKDFTIVEGSNDCGGMALDQGTVNRNGHTISFVGTSPGTFTNCP